MTTDFLILSAYLLRAFTVESPIQSCDWAPRLQDTMVIAIMRAMDELPDIPGVDPELLKDPVFRRVLEDALDIQERFSAEPIYARTGIGYLKSAGVAEIKAVKEQLRSERETSLVREDP